MCTRGCHNRPTLPRNRPHLSLPPSLHPPTHPPTHLAGRWSVVDGRWSMAGRWSVTPHPSKAIPCRLGLAGTPHNQSTTSERVARRYEAAEPRVRSPSPTAGTVPYRPPHAPSQPPPSTHPPTHPPGRSICSVVGGYITMKGPLNKNSHTCNGGLEALESKRK